MCHGPYSVATDCVAKVAIPRTSDFHAGTTPAGEGGLGLHYCARFAGQGGRRMITWASHAGQGTAEGVVPSSCVLLRPGPCFLRRARWRHMPCAGLTCLLRAGREACRCPAPDLKHEPREALAGFPPAPALHSVACCWRAATGSVVASRVLSTSSAVPTLSPFSLAAKFLRVPTRGPRSCLPRGRVPLTNASARASAQSGADWPQAQEVNVRPSECSITLSWDRICSFLSGLYPTSAYDSSSIEQIKRTGTVLAT